MLKRRLAVAVCLLAALAGAVVCQKAGAQAVAAGEMVKTAEGIRLPVRDGFLTVSVIADDVLRVTFSKDIAFSGTKKSIMRAARMGATPKWEVSTEGSVTTVSTAKVKARVDNATGVVSFTDSAGKAIASELPEGRTLEAVEIQGEKTFSVRQQWAANPEESLYGMGENQLNLLNIKGYDLDFWQHNGSVVIPMLVSSKGYGILWDNTSWTRFGDLREFQPIAPQFLFDKGGKAGGLTATELSPAGAARGAAKTTETIGLVTPSTQPTFTGEVYPSKPGLGRSGGARAVSDFFPKLATHPPSTQWEGEVLAPVAGEYQFRAYYNGGLKVWIDGKLVIDHWKQLWLPWYEIARVRLEANHRYAIRLEWDTEQATQLKFAWKLPPSAMDGPAGASLQANGTSLWSQVGDGIDYYFCYGPSIDRVIGGYRAVTGQAPLMPLWAFGLWQSRQRFQTAQECLEVVDEFRRRKIPLDIIVQDWQYWPGDPRAYGSHGFDPVRFPNPDRWIEDIHQKNAKLLLSVWSWYAESSTPFSGNFNEMKGRGFLFDKASKTFIDMYNPEAQKMFWAHINTALFSKGVDAWWLDGSEPEIFAGGVEGFRTAMNPTAMGSGSRVLNGYPLLENKAVYEGQRAAAPDQRVLLLTRSAFAGQQRYASAVWSGDTSSTWQAMEKQIAAGLSFSISGMPYWSMDSGGFAVPERFSTHTPTPADQDEWDELQTRWFQFAAFVPLTRVHGEFPFREMYQYHADDHPAYQTQLKFNKLRYALLPYVYSLAGDVTMNAGTMMRPLLMDFQGDAKAREVKDQFMFGPAFLVSPVVHYKDRRRAVYLPEGAGWYDFWTGKPAPAGKVVDAAAPFDSMPLFVKAGSIVPTCPVMQYTGEKPMDPLTLHVYTGADGAFTLYEDDGQTYGYERGQYARTTARWDEASRTLTLGKREDGFAKMLARRTINVVFVSPEKAAGFSFEAAPDKAVVYTGEAMKVSP